MKTDRPDAPADAPADEGLLQRWSRRKVASAAPSPVAAPPAPDPEPEPPGDEDMVPIESLDQDSDYTPFLSPRVSAELQQLALRKLFRAPSFNLRDGLDDYDEDFRAFVPLGEVITADMKHRLEVAARRLAEAPPEPPPAPGPEEPAHGTAPSPPRVAATPAGDEDDPA